MHQSLKIVSQAYIALSIDWPLSPLEASWQVLLWKSCTEIILQWLSIWCTSSVITGFTSYSVTPVFT